MNPIKKLARWILRDEIKNWFTPDMFWDNDDPERPFESIEEVFFNRGMGQYFNPVEIQRAVTMPNIFCVLVPNLDDEEDDEYEDDYEKYQFDTLEEAEAFITKIKKERGIGK